MNYPLDWYLRKGDLKLLNRTQDSWYFRIKSYYKRRIDIVINDRYNKVECECYHVYKCVLRNCKYVKLCKEFTEVHKDDYKKFI